MGYLVAKNDKQLGLCLRMLYADNIPFTVKVVENNKQRIEFHVYAGTDESKVQELTERFRILVS